MTRDEQIKQYLETAEKSKATEYYLENKKTQSLIEMHETNVQEQNRLWVEYNLSRQELTDYNNKKRNVYKATSVNDALQAMERFFK